MNCTARFRETAGPVCGNALLIIQLGVACEFCQPAFFRPIFNCLKDFPANAALPHIRIHLPAFKVSDRDGRRAVHMIVPNGYLGETTERFVFS